MFFTGFADEAASDIRGQAEAIKELGWSHIELRAVNGKNIIELDEDAFAEVLDTLQEYGLTCNAVGSDIGSWSKSILDPFEETMDQVERCIPRMHALGVKYVRIMSYAVLSDREPDDQMLGERLKRLNWIVQRFSDSGLEALHENCGNYGGMGIPYTQKLLDGVAGLRLIFDTANAATGLDRSKPKPYPPQCPWTFYQAFREHIVHVHIKDAVRLRGDLVNGFEEAQYVMPGEGDAQVTRICTALLESGYAGGFSIEPHLAVVYHDATQSCSEEERLRSFIDYGRAFDQLIKNIEL